MRQYIHLTLVVSYFLDSVCGSKELNFKSNVSLPHLLSNGKKSVQVFHRNDLEVAPPRRVAAKRHGVQVPQKRLVQHALVPRGFVESKHLRAGSRAVTSQHRLRQMPRGPINEVPKMPLPGTNIAPLPMGLQAYCASKKGKIGMGQVVEADWKGYGPYYKADVIKVHPDGSYDLKYHDGWIEEHVPADRIKALPTKGPNVNPADSDPACKLSNTVQGIQSRVDQAHEDIAIWLMERHQKEKAASSDKDQRTPQEIDGDVREVKRQLAQKFGTNKDNALAAADTDGDGSVSKGELAALLEQLGNPKGRAEQLASSVMKKFDKDGDGIIADYQYKDLLQAAAKKPKAPSPGPRMAAEVGKELNDYFGSSEKALQEADENKDNQVSEEELENVLEDMGHSPDRADELANVTMATMDPNNTGIIPASKFKELASEQGLAAASGQGHKQQAKIEELEEQAVDHEKEYNKLKGELEELRKKMKADLEAGNTDPKSDEEKRLEIARLEAALQSHTDELGHILGTEPDQESGKEVVDEEAAEDMGLDSSSLLDVIQKHAEGITKRTSRLKAKMERLRDEGTLDPELEFQVLKLTESSDKMTGPMHHIATDQKIAVDDPDAHAEMEEDLERDLGHLDDDIREVRKFSAEMDTEVIPGNKKWWRYRWEYCYVEALLLILLCVLAIIWEGIYNLIRARINYLSTKSPFFKASQHHNTLYFNWFVYMTGEFSVLLCVVFTLWVLDHFGIFELWISVQYDIAPEIHQPATRNIYSRQAYDIAMQLFFAMAIFYALCMAIVVSAVHKERNWKDFETNSAVTTRSSFSVVSIVGDDEEYQAMKQYFDEASQHEMGPTFQFWLYLSLNVRHNMTDIYNIKVLTWVVFLVTFIVFLLSHRYLHLSYIHLFAVLGALDLLIFGGMIWLLHQEKVWLATETQRGSSQASQDKKPSIHEKYATERWVCIALQILLFFLCYGIARILCSPWTWLFYFYLALGIIVVFIIFALFFRLYLAPTIILFMAIMCLPPYLDEGNKKMLAESCATVD